MGNIEVKTFCECTYNCTYIPMYLYQDDVLTGQIYSNGEEVLLPPAIERQILSKDDTISVYETVISSYYGKITLPSQNTSVILGPIYPQAYSTYTLQQFFFNYGIPSVKQKKYGNFLSMIPSRPLLSFVSLLYQMKYALTGELTNLPQGALAPYRLKNIPNAAEITAHSKDNLEHGYHNTLYENQRITMPLIANGDMEGLIRYSQQHRPMTYGIYSENLREQQMVVFVISVISAMSAAVQGGMAQQESLSMAEFYIRKGLRLASPADIDALSMRAIVEFTKRVQEEKQGHANLTHSTISSCMQYIRERIYTPITVAEVAQFSGYSEEHFSRLFKKEAGCNASEYITDCKLYEAKKLLRYTKMSIGEVSSQLFFSNQSHFQKQFKRKFQMTPLQFRNASE